MEIDNSEILETLSQYATKYCVIGSLNINSLSGKFSEVQEWIEAFDILSIQETKIDRSFPDSQFAIGVIICIAGIARKVAVVLWCTFVNRYRHIAYELNQVR